MKVSILTYHREDNYGAVMQAYATCKAIELLGHQPEFIDLRLPEVKKSVLSKLVFWKKHYRFNRFRKKFFKSETPVTYHSLPELQANPPQSDCYLVGSDQTWNPLIAKKLLRAFFLDFGDKRTRRISYATSIGMKYWPTLEQFTNAEIRELLLQFDKILLREKTATEIAKNLWGVDTEKVIDPVLLFPSYPELIGHPEESNEIIVYKLVNDPKFYEYAKALSQEMKLPIRSIGSVRRPKGFRSSYPEKIEKWIRRIATAKLVLTDSFHGTVFALLYQRPFIVYVGNPARVTRLEELLRDLGLQDRILLQDATMESFNCLVDTPIEWSEVNSKLNILREHSLSKLRLSLKAGI